MRRLLFGLAFFLLAGAVSPAAAQVGYGELERYYWPGAYVPYGGANYQTRYNYYPAMIETGFGYGRNFRHYEVMEQIDREERAWVRANSRLLPFERMGPLFGRREAPVQEYYLPGPSRPPLNQPPIETLPLPLQGPPIEVPPPPVKAPPAEPVTILTNFTVGS